MLSIPTQSISEHKAIDTLRAAFEGGIPVIPFLAAGISAGAGFPVASDLRQYLAKVAFFIRYGVYKLTLGLESADSFTGRTANDNAALTFAHFINSTSRYISEFGWPDPNQLDADLWHFCQESATTAAGKPGSSLLTWIDQFLAASDPSYITHTNYSRRAPIAYGGSRKYWGRVRWRLDTATQQMLIEHAMSKDRELTQSNLRRLRRLCFAPRCDWFELLLELAEGNLGLVDALFVKIGLNRPPGDCHALLAKLASQRDMSLWLTTNHDTLLETAFRSEGLQPLTFDLTRDSPPPDPASVRQALAIIKLHGSAFGIRVGERTHYSLDTATRETLLNLLPDDALLLVMGFSGGERRMMQLLEAVALSPDAKKRKILWLSFEPDEHLSEQFRRLDARMHNFVGTEQLVRCHITDAADFLHNMEQRLFFAVPNTRVRFNCLRKRIIPLSAIPHATTTPTARPALEDGKKYSPVRLFVRESLVTAASPPGRLLDPALNSPTLAMSDFTRGLDGYRVIWIDLEEHHTISGIVIDLIDRMRVYDLGLPGLQLPVDDKPSKVGPGADDIEPRAAFRKAVRFLHRALRRGRYVLAFDSIEAFGREHTSHHGLPSQRKDEDDSGTRAVARVERLMSFLGMLLCLPSEGSRDCSQEQLDILELDWYCLLSCDEPTTRHLRPQRSATDDPITAIRTSLRQFVKSIQDLQNNPTTPGAQCFAVSTFALGDATAAVDASASPPDALTLANTRHALGAYMSYASEYAQTRDLLTWSSAIDLLGHATGQWLTEAIKVALTKAVIKVTVTKAVLDSPGHKPQNQDELRVAMFLVMAVFRRPRPIAALYDLGDYFLQLDTARSEETGTLFAESFLKEACRDDVAIAFEMAGGFAWIPHYVHEGVYKWLSEPVRSRYAMSASAEDFAKQVAEHRQLVGGKIIRLLFLAYAHSHIARFYYLFVFHRAHDPAALFEYIYHRVSALKYTKQLLLVYRAVMRCDRSAREALLADNDLRLGKFIEGVCQQEGEQVPTVDENGLFIALLSLRRKHLRALFNVLRRERDTVLSCASTDTWLAWIGQVSIDLEEIVPTERGIKRYAVDPSLADIWFERDLPEDENVVKETRELSGNLRDLLDTLAAELLREKRAWSECIVCRTNWLERNLLLNGELRLKGKTLTLFRESVEAGFRAVRDAVKNGATAAGLKEAFRKLFEQKIDLPGPEGSVKAGVFAAAWRQYKDIQMQSGKGVSIEILGMCTRDIVACVRHIAEGTQEERARLAAELGEQILAAVKDQFRERDGGTSVMPAWRGVEVDLRAEILRFHLEANLSAASHRRWVSVLGIRDGEAAPVVFDDKLLSETRQLRQSVLGIAPGEQLALRVAKLNALAAVSAILHGSVADARKALAEAESGLAIDRQADRRLLAVVKELEAEAALTEIKRLIGRNAVRLSEMHGNGTDERLREAYGRARGEARLARRNIEEVERLLRGGRTNAGQWHRVYDVRARLCVHEMLVELIGIEVDERRWNSVEGCVSWVHGKAYEGLEAIRGGLDCSPYIVARKEMPTWVKDKLRPFISRWCEMMVVSFYCLAEGVLFAVQNRPVLSGQPIALNRSGHWRRIEEYYRMKEMNRAIDRTIVSPEAFTMRWQALNRSAGLNRIVRDRPLEGATLSDAVNRISSWYESSANRYAHIGVDETGGTSERMPLSFHEQAAQCIDHCVERHCEQLITHVGLDDIGTSAEEVKQDTVGRA